MNSRTISRFFLFSLVQYVVFCAADARAQRVLELSSRKGVMFLSVSIMDSSGKVVKTGEINGRGYEWFEVPESAEKFQLKGLGIQTQSVPLFKADNTFVSVATKPPTQFDLSKQSGIDLKKPKAEKRTQDGTSGFIFVGKLEGITDESEWKSIYLAGKNGRRLDQDDSHPLTYKLFKDMALAPNTVLTVDFPLNLRDLEGSKGVVKDVVRSGQKVVISEISNPTSTSIYAKVTVKNPSK